MEIAIEFELYPNIITEIHHSFGSNCVSMFVTHNNFLFTRKSVWKMWLENESHFVQAIYLGYVNSIFFYISLK